KGMPIAEFEGIPVHDEDGLLHPGLHHATWDAFAARFGTNDLRRRKMLGLLAGMHMAEEGGRQWGDVGGSFVTGKELPGDVDCRFDYKHVDFAILDPMLDTRFMLRFEVSSAWHAREFGNQPPLLRRSPEDSTWQSERRPYLGLDMTADPKSWHYR